MVDDRDDDSDSDSLDILRAGNKTKKPKSRKPPNNAFRQQRLKAWQPILNPKTVLPLFLFIGLLFAPFGALLIYASYKIKEVVIDYTYCGSSATLNEWSDIPEKYVSEQFTNAPLNSKNSLLTQSQWRLEAVNGSTDLRGDPNSGFLNTSGEFQCRIRFTLPEEMKHPVYMYYRLTEFYQNHRRYVSSFDELQIEGEARTVDELNSANNCKPLVSAPDGRPYYPCGLVANSVFNDTFTEPVRLLSDDGLQNETYFMTTKGISWGSDINRFKKTKYNYTQVVPPPNWAKRYPNGYTADNFLDISQDEGLQNWMRTAGLARFAKLMRRNDSASMPEGRYEVVATLNFPSHLYGGTKSILFSTRSVVGGRNNFLGIAYVVVAGLCIILATVFLIRHLVKPRKLGDHSYLSWNHEEQHHHNISSPNTGESSSKSRYKSSLGLDGGSLSNGNASTSAISDNLDMNSSKFSRR